MKRKIGFFGGSFDPIHFGHLHLALQLLEIHGLDEVWFCPASLSPFKEGDPPHASAEARCEMVKLAIAPIPAFKLIDEEITREGPSYTIDTIRSLKEKEKGEYFLILGEDNLHDLSRWKQVEELLKLAPPLIGSRLNVLGSHQIEIPRALQEIVQAGMTKIPLMEISSTYLREERLPHKLYCGHLIPGKVLDYIYQNQLYLI